MYANVTIKLFSDALLFKCYATGSNTSNDKMSFSFRQHITGLYMAISTTKNNKKMPLK